MTFFGLIKNGIIYFIKRYSNEYKGPAVNFIHSWQIEQPNVPLKIKFKNPFMIPYSGNIKNSFVYIISEFRTQTIYNYFKENDI